MQEQEYIIPVIPNGIEMIQDYYLYLNDNQRDVCYPNIIIFISISINWTYK